MCDMTKEEKEAFVREAQERYRDNDIDVDDIAAVSHAEDWRGAGGAYVQAWVWVPTPSGLPPQENRADRRGQGDT